MHSTEEIQNEFGAHRISTKQDIRSSARRIRYFDRAIYRRSPTWRTDKVFARLSRARIEFAPPGRSFSERKPACLWRDVWLWRKFDTRHQPGRRRAASAKYRALPCRLGRRTAASRSSPSNAPDDAGQPRQRLLRRKPRIAAANRRTAEQRHHTVRARRRIGRLSRARGTYGARADRRRRSFLPR